MSVNTYTKSGTKATAAAKLPKEVFGVEEVNHELLKHAYVANLANARENLAKTLTRGDVRGGGKKPWKQKGTGRARFGSSRVPIWRGGGITFGPTGNENYSHKVNTKTNREAIKHALSACNDKISVIETFECKDGKTKTTANLLKKMGLKGNTLMVVSVKDDLVKRATNNIPTLKVVQAKYLSVRNVLDADNIVISSKSVDIIGEWLGGKK